MTQASVQQQFQQAVRLHLAGRLAEAERGYRQVLSLQPNHAECLHMLGSMALQVGNAAAAVDLCKQAIALQPNSPLTFNNLSYGLRNLGQFEQAIAASRQAIALKPDFAEAYSNLGLALQDAGQSEEAVTACRQAIALKPDYAAAYANLAQALSGVGQLEEAADACRQALRLDPKFAEAHYNLGNALRELCRFGDAVAAYEQAIVHRPNFPDAYSNLSIALHDLGRLPEAVAAVQHAIALKPNNPQAFGNLGNALRDKGDFIQAVAAYERGIELNPRLPELHNNIAHVLCLVGQTDRAIESCQLALALQPDFANAENTLANALKASGQVDQALAAYKRASDLDPHDPLYLSNLVFASGMVRGASVESLGRLAKEWDDRHGVPLRTMTPVFANDRDADRPLRIGYVSPDFREHPVGRCMLALLSQHNPAQFQVYSYAQAFQPDDLTQQLRGHTHVWRAIIGLNNADLVQTIRDDRIDILVDLALHTSGNRLLVFARQPAPLQVSFAGYPGSTGLRTIGYRISDVYLDPPEPKRQADYETVLRLPHSFWCYQPQDCLDIPIGPLPAQGNGFVTFGCLSNFCKINPPTLMLWAQVLRQVPRSRLLLLADEGSHRQRTLDVLNDHGVDPSRVEFVGRRPHRDYLHLYDRIDIGLDSFPYNGHTTSLDSLWMGVPVVTRVGQTPVARAGWSQLSNLKLTELVANSPEQFVQIATDLANDLPRLANLRATLRLRMEASPLMDAKGFARDIEALYRTIWKDWCSTEQSK